MTDQLTLDYDLDPHEARVLSVLRSHRGRARAIRVDDLGRLIGTSGREVQEIVHRLRIEHGVAIASAAGKPAGYYLVETTAELEQCYHEHRSKALSTLAAMAALRRVALPELLGQLAIEVAR
jgi:biotin operon repressor